MATITKVKLTRNLARDLDIPRLLALKTVDALFKGVRESLQKGNRIEIRGFGVLTVKEMSAKSQARNPRTGEKVFVPARRKVAFKPGRIIRKALSQSLEE